MVLVKMNKKLRVFIHVIVAIQFALGCLYDWYYVKIPMDAHRMAFKFIGGKFKYLTFCDAVLQTVFYIICFLNDIFGSNEVKPKRTPLIRTIKDRLLSCLAFPLAMFVGLTFWALYAVDRELVFPKALDEFFPTWLNHVMHTNIMLFILIELSTSFRKYPSRKFGLGVLLAFMFTYLVWIHIIHHYSGVWVYPVLEALNFPLRIVFFLTLLVLSVSLYLLGEKLNGMIWSDELKAVSGAKSKRDSKVK